MTVYNYNYNYNYKTYTESYHRTLSGRLFQQLHVDTRKRMPPCGACNVLCGLNTLNLHLNVWLLIVNLNELSSMLIMERMIFYTPVKLTFNRRNFLNKKMLILCSFDKGML